MAALWELWDVLMIMWTVVSQAVKTFPLKWEQQEIWQQNHLKDHERPQWV